MNDIFQQKSFGTSLRMLVEKKKLLEPKFSFGALADGCQIQRSYLSQAIHQKARLNPDQVYSITRFFALSRDEAKYLSLLNDIETTGLKERRDELELERRRLQDDKLKTENKIVRASIEKNGEQVFRYYTNWATPLVHMFLTVPQYRRKPESIRTKLGLDEEVFAECLFTLKSLSLISVDTKAIKVIQDKLHLPSSSYFSRSNAISFRQKAIEYLQKTRTNEDHYFTASFSGTVETQLQIKALFLKFIEEAASEIEKANCEEVFQINFDLFRI